MVLKELKETDLPKAQLDKFNGIFNQPDLFQYIKANSKADVIIFQPDKTTAKNPDFRVLKNIPHARSGVPLHLYVMAVRAQLVGGIQSILISGGKEAEKIFVVNIKDFNRLRNKAINEEIYMTKLGKILETFRANNATEVALLIIDDINSKYNDRDFFNDPNKRGPGDITTVKELIASIIYNKDIATGPIGIDEIEFEIVKNASKINRNALSVLKKKLNDHTIDKL